MSRTDEMRSLVEKLSTDRAARNTGSTMLRTNTAAFRQEMHEAHTTMARNQARQFAADRNQLVATHRQMVRDIAAFRNNIQTTQQTTANTLREQLATHRNKLAEDTAMFLHQARESHTAMAQAQTEMLVTNHAKVNNVVMQMAEDTAAFRREIQDAHMHMARNQAEQLAAERDQLITDTTQIIENAATFVRELRADTVGVATAWQQFSTGLTETDDRATTVAMERMEKQNEQTVSSPSMVDTDDSLTAIRGIGPTIQDKLYAAGITTYAQLAEATIEDLHTAIGSNAARIVNVEEWIEQASTLMKTDRS